MFNNAGIGYFAAFEESAEGETRRMMEINVFGLAAVAKAVLPGMRARRAGTIVNVSSVGGVRSLPAVSWYNASKFAVEGLSESMAQELAPLGVRIVLVEPSAFATDWAGNSAAETLPEYEIPDNDSTAREYGRNFRAAGHDMVVGGGDELREIVECNRITPEPVKAAAHARLVRPDR